MAVTVHYRILRVREAKTYQLDEINHKQTALRVELDRLLQRDLAERYRLWVQIARVLRRRRLHKCLLKRLRK